MVGEGQAAVGNGNYKHMTGLHTSGYVLVLSLLAYLTADWSVLSPAERFIPRSILRQASQQLIARILGKYT